MKTSQYIETLLYMAQKIEEGTYPEDMLAGAYELLKKHNLDNIS